MREANVGRSWRLRKARDVAFLALLAPLAMTAVASGTQPSGAIQSDDSRAAEAGDPAEWPDMADQGLPDLDLLEQVARIVSAPQRIAPNVAFTVVAKFEGPGTVFQGPIGNNRQGFQQGYCDVQGLKYDSSAGSWSVATGPSLGHFWYFDAFQDQWELLNDGHTTDSLQVTLTPSAPEITAYGLVYRCNDPDGGPSGERFQVTIVFDRTPEGQASG